MMMMSKVTLAVVFKHDVQCNSLCYILFVDLCKKEKLFVAAHFSDTKTAHDCYGLCMVS